MRRVVGAVACFGALTALLMSSAGAGAGTTPHSYLILAKRNALHANLATQIENAGGTLTNTVPEVGIAVASSSSASFKTDAAELGTVLPNLNLQWAEPVQTVAGPDFGYPPASGDNDALFNLQWGHTAVDAVGAWNAGYRGDGAKVAVLDQGFDLDHVDLTPNIVGAVSFVDGEGPGFASLGFSHGSHVAGIVAAADNGFGTIGVAPLADLLLVKVLGDAGGGSFEDVIEGIVYAADQDADVINMSLGARLLKSGDPDDPEPYTAREAVEFRKAIGRATTYAYQQGTTVIASAGNDAEDKDHTANAIHLPADAPHVVSIAATGPNSWALDPTTDLDLPAFYTNFGQSAIDFAAPGGNVDFDIFPPNPQPNCTVAGVAAPCWVFDLVFSTSSNLDPTRASYAWAAGTSMAAPHTSGVAAIIIGAHGGSMNPSQVEAALRASADDLGKPGNDDFYGGGRANAANAVG